MLISEDKSQPARLPRRIKVFLWLTLLISLGWLTLWGYTGYFRALISISGGSTLSLILVMVVPVLLLAGSSWLLVSSTRAGLKKRALIALVIAIITLVGMAVILFTPVLDGFLYGWVLVLFGLS